MSRIAVITALRSSDTAAAVDDLTDYLGRCGLPTAPLPEADAILVWADERLPDDMIATLLSRGVPVLFGGATLETHLDRPALADAAGVVAARSTPRHEIRLRTAPAADEMLITDRWLELDKTLDDVDVLATAMIGLDAHAVLTWRPATRVGLLTTAAEPATLRDPAMQRLIHRWVRRALGLSDGPPVRVGILGYGAIGHEHSAAISSVDGLVLAGVCDKSAERVATARLLAPDVTAYDDGDALLASPDVDLVVVSTPPNTHAEWALRAIDAGKHVVVEKPFCLTTAEADEMIAAATAAGRTISVYQNRRWDADYLTVKRLIRSGAIGFGTLPKWGFSEVVPYANSCRLVLPTFA